jgi:toxin YoeB
MQVNWDVQAEQDYKFFLKKDRRAIEKIKKLLESLEEKYDQGIGKPERLKGYKERLIYSRRIDEKNRIIYEVMQDKNKQVLSITILGLKGHYNNK